MPEQEWNIDENGLPPENNPMWGELARESVNDARTVNTPEDPRIEQADQSHSIADLEHLKEAVRDFVRREYMDELHHSAFDDITCIGIAETNAEDREDIIIQMALNIENLTLDQYINGDKMDSWHYADLASMTQEIRHISFDELVSLGPNAEKRVHDLLKQFPTEHDFLRNPEDSFALYQLKGGPQYHELRFSSMDELKRDAQQFREDVHHAVDRAENMWFGGKAAVEKYLRDEGFTVLPNDDPAMITVANSTRMTSTVYIGGADDCCFIDGCDTRPCDEPVRHDHYEMTYTGPLVPNLDEKQDPNVLLENLYYQFNMNRPKDFAGHSMSVSDVVVIRQDGQLNCYYTDSFGFEKLPNFLSQFEYLRNAEMALEDDFDMVGDGIINNGPKEERKQEPRSFREVLEDAKEEISRQPRKQRPPVKDDPSR